MSNIRTPRLHQHEAMNFHENSKMLGTLAWHGMGLGKTLTSLWLARKHLAVLRKQGVVNPKFMVIVPKSAIPTWKVECHKHTPDLLQCMVIYPYSQLHSAVKSLKYMDIRMLVFDESHYLKSPETSRIEHLAVFLEGVHNVTGKFDKGRVLQLTGTPMPNSAAELYTSWAICCAPNLLEAAARLRDKERYENWKKTFSKRKEQSWSVGRGKNKRKNFGSKFEGVDNEDKLQQLLAPFVHYKRVEDCIDLPEKEEVYIDLGLADDKLLADANIEAPEQYMALLERLARAKTAYAIDWVRDYLAAGKQQLLVFANYRFPLEELYEKYPNDVRMITGSESGVIRAQNLKDFQEGKFRVLVMTYKCGSESLNLQNAFVSLYLSYPWTDAGVKQAMARTYRSGQGKRTLHYFLTSGINDQKILGLVRAKEEATTKVEDLMLIANTFKMKLDDLL
jgi:SNF2 family DNA or RNA helicase